MILSCDFQSYITFEFAQRQRGMPLSEVAIPRRSWMLWWKMRGSRQEMDRSHLGPDQAFPYVRQNGVRHEGAKLILTPSSLQARSKARLLKTGPVVDWMLSGNPATGLASSISRSRSQAACRIQHAAGRGSSTIVTAAPWSGTEFVNHARENVERKGQPRPTNGFACFLVDDESVDLRIID